MKRKQFDDFYFVKDGQIHKLDEVQAHYEKITVTYLIIKEI